MIRKKNIHTLFSNCRMAGSCGFPTHAGLGASGCCGGERKIHTAGSKNWERNPLIPLSPENTCPHALENGRKPSQSRLSPPAADQDAVCEPDRLCHHVKEYSYGNSFFCIFLSPRPHGCKDVLQVFGTLCCCILYMRRDLVILYPADKPPFFQVSEGGS